MKHFHFDWDCFKVGTIFGTANCSFENVLCSFFFKNGLEVPVNSFIFFLKFFPEFQLIMP